MAIKQMAVLKADKAYRRRTFILLFLLVLPLLPMIHWGLPVLAAYACGRPVGKLLPELQISLQLLFLVPVLFAVYSYRLGRRVLASGVWPPPGQKVIVDTIILEGKVARRRGYLIIFLSVFMLVIALSAAFIVVPRAFDKIWKDIEAQGRADVTLESEFGPNCRDMVLRRSLQR